MNQQRIKLTDNTMDVVVKMCDGNPGAMDALVSLLKPENVKIDPDNIMGPLGPILSLDSFGIYGTDIYVLFSDICGRNIAKMVAVIRATQMGLFSRDILKDAAHRQDYSGRDMVPVDDLYNKIKEMFPLFNSPEPSIYTPQI